MKRVIEHTGWVPKGEKMSQTLQDCAMQPKLVKELIEGGIYKTRRQKSFQRRRIKVTIEVENV